MNSVFDSDNVKPKAVAVDPPPDDTNKSKRGRPKGSVGQKTIDRIEDSINEFLALPAMYFATIGDEYCAYILAGEDGPGRQLAHSWANLAKQSPGVRRVLMRMIEGGAWGGVITSSVMVALPIAAHHGAVPERMARGLAIMGMAPPPDHPEDNGRANGL